MLDRQRLEYRQTIVSHLLVLYRTAHQHVVITICPVIRDALHETVYALGKEVEPQVTAHAHHTPAVRPPLIGILEQKIRCKACEHHLARLNFPTAVTLTLNGQIECGGLAGQIAPYLASIHLILPVHIAVLATRTYLGTSMPRVPIRIYAPMLRHIRKNNKKLKLFILSEKLKRT